MSVTLICNLNFVYLCQTTGPTAGKWGNITLMETTDIKKYAINKNKPWL